MILFVRNWSTVLTLHLVITHTLQSCPLPLPHHSLTLSLQFCFTLNPHYPPHPPHLTILTSALTWPSLSADPTLPWPELSPLGSFTHNLLIIPPYPTLCYPLQFLYSLWSPSLERPLSVREAGVWSPTASHHRCKNWEVCASQHGAWVS